MNSNKINNSPIISKWLKRIFSLQTLSIIIALFGTYYTYKAFIENQPAEISFKIPKLEGESLIYEDARDLSNIWTLGIYKIPPVEINRAIMGGIENMLLFPIIGNKSDKSIQHFRCKIHVWYDHCMAKLFKDSKEASELPFINSEYYTINSETEHNIVFSYNFDYLPAQTRLPNPINFFYLFLAEKEISTTGGLVKFHYSITYDGAKEPLEFQYTARMYYNENSDDNFTKRATERFLQNDVFTSWVGNEKYDGRWAIIINNKFYDDIKHLSSDEFAKSPYRSIRDLQN